MNDPQLNISRPLVGSVPAMLILLHRTLLRVEKGRMWKVARK